MIDQALDLLAYLASRFSLGLIFTVFGACTFAPLFMDRDNHTDPHC